MARVHGLSHRDIDRLVVQVEAAASRSLLSVVEHVQAGLTAAAGELPAGPAVVSLDNLGAIQTRWSAEVDQHLAPMVAGAFGESADALGVAISSRFEGFEVPKVSSDVAEGHLAGAVNRMKNTGNVVWEQTRNQLVDGLRAGESIGQLSARLETVHGMAEADATRVARTEVIAAVNVGSFTMAQTTGLDMEKFWLATEDLRTRPSHHNADGQHQPLSQPFDVGGFSLQVPGDPTGPAGEVINCRCTLGYDIPDDQPALAAKPATPTPETPAEPASKPKTTPRAPARKAPATEPVEAKLPATPAAPAHVLADVPESAYVDVDASTAQAMQDGLKPWTSAQRDSLQYYTGGEYVQMNAFLRTGEEVPAAIKKYVKGAQAAMRPSTQPMVLYRGTKASQFGLGDRASLADLKKLVGETMEDKGFMSTSVGSANAFKSRVLLQIEAPPGTDMAFVKSVSYVKNEDEMLLAAGTRYKVLSVAKKGDQVVVRVRVTA